MVYAHKPDECKCEEGFQPQMEENGDINCHGTILKSILPCNIIFKPDCLCNDTATTVIQESSGMYTQIYENNLVVCDMIVIYSLYIYFLSGFTQLLEMRIYISVFSNILTVYK